MVVPVLQGSTTLPVQSLQRGNTDTENENENENENANANEMQ